MPWRMRSFKSGWVEHREPYHKAFHRWAARRSGTCCAMRTPFETDVTGKENSRVNAVILFRHQPIQILAPMSSPK